MLYSHTKHKRQSFIERRGQNSLTWVAPPAIFKATAGITTQPMLAAPPAKPELLDDVIIQFHQFEVLAVEVFSKPEELHSVQLALEPSSFCCRLYTLPSPSPRGRETHVQYRSGKAEEQIT